MHVNARNSDNNVQHISFSNILPHIWDFPDGRTQSQNVYTVDVEFPSTDRIHTLLTTTSNRTRHYTDPWCTHIYMNPNIRVYVYEWNISIEQTLLTLYRLVWFIPCARTAMRFYWLSLLLLLRRCQRYSRRRFYWFSQYFTIRQL